MLTLNCVIYAQRGNLPDRFLGYGWIVGFGYSFHTVSPAKGHGERRDIKRNNRKVLLNMSLVKYNVVS